MVLWPHQRRQADTSMITYGSVCSGIEAATVAWKPFGWQAAWLAEIEKFPSAVLAHHYPSVPNLGDMTTIADKVLAGEVVAPDVLTGGTPCQAFSVAGARKGLSDERGQLSLEFCKLANAIDTVRAAQGNDPAVIVWENVPGVLSSKDNAFGCFLAGLAGDDVPCEAPDRRRDKKGAWISAWKQCGVVVGPKRLVVWRVLDAQWFGVAQRRRRVWVCSVSVEHPRAWAIAESLLPLGEGLPGDPPSRSQTRQETTHPIAPCFTAIGRGVERTGCIRGQDPVVAVESIKASNQDLQHGHGHLVFGGNNTLGPNEVAAALNANRGCHNPGDFEAGNLITQPLPFDTTQITSKTNGSNPQHGDPSHPLASQAHPPAIAVSSDTLTGESPAYGCDLQVDPTCLMHESHPTLASGTHGGHGTSVLVNMCIRRLTPTECERLQGFPDNYTANIPVQPVVASGQKKARRLMNEGSPLFAEIDGVIWKITNADGPRYKALGNSWAVPCARWIGWRIKDLIK